MSNLTLVKLFGYTFPSRAQQIWCGYPSYKTMINLQQLLCKYKGSICAFGDYNTIPGHVSDAINQAIQPEFEFVLNDELSFFGAYFDTIPHMEGSSWVSILNI